MYKMLTQTSTCYRTAVLSTSAHWTAPVWVIHSPATLWTISVPWPPSTLPKYKTPVLWRKRKRRSQKRRKNLDPNQVFSLLLLHISWNCETRNNYYLPWTLFLHCVSFFIANDLIFLGEIRLTTALDGSTLYCCPECHMAYPEKELLEQHLVGHTLERRFVCDICGAGLKRKDHLTRHKQSHNPERPFVCSVCLKAFKRKEQLTLHFVIHSGEKRHICAECGKGFYRKDHLRKHTRSHIARRVKAELSQQGTVYFRNYICLYRLCHNELQLNVL